VFERFTDRARRVIVLAQEEARRLGHSHIGTEHLLLGLVHEGAGIGAVALESLGISVEELRQDIEAAAGTGDGPSSQTHIPFTAPAKQALELSLRAALRLGHNYIGTEHLLLGLLTQEDHVAAQLIQSKVGNLDQVRACVLDLVGSAAAESEAGGGPAEGVGVGPAAGFGPGPGLGFSAGRLGVVSCPHPSEDLTWEPVDVPGPGGERAAAVVRCNRCRHAIGVLRAN
jgi:ATP-dependent Clp protease ATP-binding subunit ClpC